MLTPPSILAPIRLASLLNTTPSAKIRSLSLCRSSALISPSSASQRPQSASVRAWRRLIALQSAAGDLDRPSELRIFKLDIPYYPSAGDWIPSNGTASRHGARVKGLQKAGRELAAAVLPVRISSLLDRVGTYCMLVEVGFLALFDLRPSPALTVLTSS